MEHIVRFEAGHDCSRFECKFDSPRCFPGSVGSHGKHGVSIRFVVKGEAGAVQFLLYTGWLPQFSTLNKTGSRFIREWGSCMMPVDLGYHSKKPLHEGQGVMDPACEFTDGEPCYYDGSGLNADDAMYALVNGGDEALWKFLEEYYRHVFYKGPYPTPAEYPKPLREAIPWPPAPASLPIP